MRILRFCAAGSVGLGIYYSVLYVLTEYAHVWYLASAIVAYILNSTSNFVLQKFWTFGNTNTESIRKHALQYTQLALVLFVGNTTMLYVAVELLHLWYLAAQVIITIILTILSYFVSERIFSR